MPSSRTPVGGVVEAGEQLGERGLPGTGRADDRDGPAGGQRQREAGEHLGSRTVREAHFIEHDFTSGLLALEAAGAARRGGLGHRGNLSQQPRDLLHRGRRRLVGVEEHAEPVDGVVQTSQIQDRGRQHTELQRALRHPVGAPQHDSGDGRVGDQPGADDIAGHLQERVAVGPGVPLVEDAEGGVVGRLAPERAHRSDAVHRLGELHDHRGDGRRPTVEDPPGPALVEPYEPVERHQRRHGHRAEAEVQPQQQRRDVDERQDDRDQFLQSLGEQFAQRLDVRGGPRDQPAGGVALVEVDAERLRVTEDPAAQIEQYVLVHTCGDDDEQVLQPARGRCGQQIGDRHRDQRPVVVVPQRRYRVVDRVRHQQRAHLHRGLLKQEQHTGQHDLGPERCEQRAQQQGRGARGRREGVVVEGVVGGGGRRLWPVPVQVPAVRRVRSGPSCSDDVESLGAGAVIGPPRIPRPGDLRTSDGRTRRSCAAVHGGCRRR